jgi:hypothetical protein
MPTPNKNKAAYPMAQAAVILDDPLRQFATDEYLTPFMQIAQDELINNYLQNPELNMLTVQVILYAVPEFTTDLSAYFAEGQPLEFLTDIVSVKERPVTNQNETAWSFLFPARDMPTFPPSAGNGFYRFTGDNIFLPGSNQATDIRIFGKFNPAPIESAESNIVPHTSIILTYRTASLVATSRGNAVLGDTYERFATNATSSLINDAIMELQAIRTRMRSYSGRVIRG